MGNNKKVATKIYKITVRYTEEEWKQLTKKVSHTSHTKSEFIRRCVMGRKLRTPSEKMFGDELTDIYNKLNKLMGWTKNFYNETEGLDKDLTRQLLSTINNCGKELLAILGSFHEKYKKDNIYGEEKE